MSVQVHEDARTGHWVVGCTDHGLLFDCVGRLDAVRLAQDHSWLEHRS